MIREAGAGPEMERIVAELVRRVEHRFWGKYRGIVVSNRDPARLGRLKVRVPSVLGPDVVTGWATPCTPYGGAADQGLLAVPDRGAGVWVEFEEGDLEFPIWVGTYWSAPGQQSQLPKPTSEDGKEEDDVQTVPTRKILKTAAGHTLQFEDADGPEGILLRDGKHGHVVTLNSKGITLTDATGNSIALSDTGLTITAKTPLTIDASGQPVRIVAASIDLAKG